MSESDAISTLITSQATVGRRGQTAVQNAVLLNRTAAMQWSNATHLSDQMRSKTRDLLFAYDAHVTLVYLEVPATQLFQRNAKRDTTLRQKDLERMLHRWEAPLAWEAHEVRYDVMAGEVSPRRA